MIVIAGFVLSMIGSLPPGLISLSVARTAMERSFGAALLLAAGAAGAEFFQAWAAVELADWMLENPEVERVFQWAAVPVFWTLAVYLFFYAKPPEASEAVFAISPAVQVGRGALLSAFNLLAVPYWFAYCGWLKVNGWWEKEGLGYTLLFSAGVTLGALAALVLYAGLARLLVSRVQTAARHANRVIALIFFGLGGKVLWDLLGS